VELLQLSLLALAPLVQQPHIFAVDVLLPAFGFLDFDEFGAMVAQVVVDRLAVVLRAESLLNQFVDSFVSFLRLIPFYFVALPAFQAELFPFGDCKASVTQSTDSGFHNIFGDKPAAEQPRSSEAEGFFEPVSFPLRQRTDYRVDED
jgi:hypothetical protein